MNVLNNSTSASIMHDVCTHTHTYTPFWRDGALTPGSVLSRDPLDVHTPLKFKLKWVKVRVKVMVKVRVRLGVKV
jgi:hypothetical protein